MSFATFLWTAGLPADAHQRLCGRPRAGPGRKARAARGPNTHSRVCRASHQRLCGRPRAGPGRKARAARGVRQPAQQRQHARNRKAKLAGARKSTVVHGVRSLGPAAAAATAPGGRLALLPVQELPGSAGRRRLHRRAAAGRHPAQRLSNLGNRTYLILAWTGVPLPGVTLHRRIQGLASTSGHACSHARISIASTWCCAFKCFVTRTCV